jgi:hypothetical protein
MKTIINLAIILFSSFSLFAQQSMYEAAEACKDFTYQEYYSVTIGNGPNGTNSISGDRYKGKLSLATNQFGKPAGIIMTNIEKNRNEIEYSFYHEKVDHYTHPAYIKSRKEKGYAYMIIDSIVFELKKVNADFSSYEIGGVWVPKLGKKTPAKSAEKKKKSLKDKMKKFKEKTATALGGGPVLKKLREADLKKMIDDYIAAMRKVQADHPLSAEEQKEVAAIDQAVVDKTASINAKNNAYWESEEGQRKLKEMGQAPTILVNDTGADFWICYGSGVSTLLKPGETQKFHYSTGSDVYRGHSIPGNNVQAKYDMGKDFMFNSQKYSGKTVKVSAVMPKG